LFREKLLNFFSRGLIHDISFSGMIGLLLRFFKPRPIIAYTVVIDKKCNPSATSLLEMSSDVILCTCKFYITTFLTGFIPALSG